MASDRGNYRALYASFWDDADQQALSHLAYRVLTTLKGTLPATGIGVVFDDMLAERCACTVPEIQAAYAELERAKGDSGIGWIVRERNVIWLVNGLRYEPNLRPSDVKHQQHVVEWLTQFGGAKSSLDVVRRYRSYYAEWFPGAKKAQKTNGGGSSEDPKPKPRRAPSIESTEESTQDPKPARKKGSSVESTEDPPEGSGEGSPEAQHNTTLEPTQHNTTQHNSGAAETRATTAAARKSDAPRSSGPSPHTLYMVRCVEALNNAQKANPRIHANEISMSSQLGKISWFEDGIPIDLAEVVIAEAAGKFEPTPDDKQISSLRYFDQKLRGRHALAGGTNGADLLRRAEQIYQVADAFNLFCYNGNADEYYARLMQGLDDPRAKGLTDKDFAAARVEDGIDQFQHRKAAVAEIAKRLESAGRA